MHPLPRNSEQFFTANYIRHHYIDYKGSGPTIIMMHGLTANAHAFDALATGLHANYRVICADLRGNGLSDAPNKAYGLEDHAKDILNLISHLGEKQVYLAGHSFGGFLGFYIAARYPAAVSKLVVLDAAKSMNPKTPQMLAGALSRLDAIYPDFDTFIAHIRSAPYLDKWDPLMLNYYRADVQDMPDGTVKPRSLTKNMTAKSMSLARPDWQDIIKAIKQPTLLVNALGNYAMGEALLPAKIAIDTAAMMQQATYKGVNGNHQTMLYGESAKETAKYITEFLSN
jgi:pimeloyl-ACP methyl ester carboxylesterase